MFRYFWWQQLWYKTRTRRTNQRNQRRQRLTRLRHHRVEPLEDRRLLSINTFDVTTTIDSADDGTEALTLREAIIAANASEGDDIINLPADTFTLGIAGAGENAAASGDLDISDQTGKITIQGAGAGQTTINADGIDRVFDILAGADFEIRGVTIAGGADPNGTSVVEGGGIRNAGALTVFASEISGNQATRWGGGVSNSGELTVADSLIVGNTGGFGGGGIFNAATGMAHIVNSTISGNTAAQVSGGGIHNDGTLTVTNGTIAENSADEGGGISSSDGSSAMLENTIVANNTADLGLDLFDARLDVAAITATGSVIGTPVVHSISHGVNGNIVGQDESFTAGLLPLADNGGPTRTHALEENSVAINAGDDAAANNAGLQFDQRGAGFARILGAAVDAGAYEFQVQEIDVLGNGVSILAGDDSPSVEDGTDFGRVDVDGGLLMRTFTIENLGHRDLLLTGGELLVELTGSTAFSVTQPVSATIGRDGSVTFDIAFDPNALGWHKATVSIANNDEDGNEDPYEFAIEGIGNGEIVVTTAVDEDGNEEVDTGLSLREAIDLANSLPGADEIGFDADLADSTIALSQEFGQLSITDDVTINGLGADQPTVSGGGHSRVFAIELEVTVAINDLTITGGQSASGGGIYNEGDLSISRAVLSSNTSDGGGGAISSPGTLTVTDSLITGNSAAANGGGIYSAGGLTLINSTISGNTAAGGGGIAIGEDAEANIINSTVFNNQATGIASYGGGILILGSLDMSNSVVAGNSSLLGPNDVFKDTGSTLVSAHSLIQQPSGHSIADGDDGNIVGRDPLLEPLADNGGPTQTHALQNGSPAIDTGDNDLLPPDLPFDQRGNGFVRIQGVHVDMGAFEFTPPDIEVLGNELLIPDGDIGPLVADLTDFGGAYFREGSVVHTFTIHNDSAGILHLDEDPVSISGPGGVHFEVTAQPAQLTLGADESSTFEIKFDPEDYGSFTATVSVVSDDPDENPYEFDVTGDGTFIMVDTLADEDGSEEISTGTSLREAIAFANRLEGDDAIEFAPNVVGTIGLTLGELTISEDVGIYGPGAEVLTVSGGGESRVFSIGPDVGWFDEESGAEIDDLTIADGAARQGGGIFNQGVLELNRVTLSGNKAQDKLNGGFGGAIFNDEFATVWLFDSTVAGNMSDWFGGGFYNHANADVYVVSSTFSGNEAELAGGASYNDGYVIAFNSTFSGNITTAADDEGLGGAFYNNGDLDVQSSTLAFNQAGVGGAIANFDGTTWLTNSIVSDNSAVTGADLFDGSLDPPSIFGWNSLISDPAEHDISDGESGNIVGVPALLGPLADNGGWTQTHALLPGSPAIDATSFDDFDPEFDIIPDFDQRGIERVQGEQFDMGSFEVRPPEIDVAGNGLSIESGDATPSFDDDTQFGRVEVDAGSVTRTFTIFNSGDHAIVLDGEPLVEIIGSDAFSVSLSPDALIAGGGSTTFDILFDPSAPGVYTATVSIDNNDSDEDPFQFTIQGVGGAIIVDVLGEDDGVAGTGEGTSLREAVELANYLDGADTIEFAAHLAEGTIELEFGQLEVFDDVTINGLGADRLTVSGTGEENESRVFMIDEGVSAEIRGLTIADGVASGLGGAILNFGTLTLVDSAVIDSTSEASDSEPGAGGGIFNDGGTLTISGSTISGNTAYGSDGGGYYYGAYGGGIANVDGGVLTITNSTISGNTADGEDNYAAGGGIINYGGTVTISSSTIADNEATSSESETVGGGIANEFPEEIELGTVTLVNTIVAENQADFGADLFDGAVPDREAQIEILAPPEEPAEGPLPSITAQSSLIGDEEGHAIEDEADGNIVGVEDPIFDPLDDNGGPTETHALILGSPAIDAGNNDLLPKGLEFDQRGKDFARVVDETTDIGAFEFRPPEIDVQGNETTIADGDDDPSVEDHTDFGTVYFNLDAVTRTFTIRNTGGYRLDLTGESAVEISGDVDAFEIVQPVTTTIAPGGEVTFDVTFVSREVGSYSATLSIANTDSDEDPYDFVIEAAYSDSILVTNPNDENNDLDRFVVELEVVDDGTSLREALNLADELDGPNTIEFHPDLAGGTIVLSGGELEVRSDVAILGLGAKQLTVSGDGRSSVFWIAEGVGADISGLTIADGSDRFGGGVYVDEGASLALTEVTIANNTASRLGGGVFVASFGELFVERSTISGNHAGFGGGSIHNDGWLTIVNSTISGNTTGNEFNDGLGGGLLNYGGATINHATIANNEAGHGGGILNMEGDVLLTNTIVGDNFASEGPSDVLDMNPGSVSGHHNLIEDPTGHTFINGLDGNIVGRRPRLGELADNGGPTATHELLRGSRARDAGDGTEAPKTDQRGDGFPRIVGEGIDIGAFEAGPLPGVTGIGIDLEQIRDGEGTHLTIFADIALMNEPDYDPETTTVQWQSSEPDAEIVTARFGLEEEDEIEVFSAMIPLVGEGFGDHLNLWIDWDGPEGEMAPDAYQVSLPEAPQFPGFVDITHPLDGSEVLAGDWNVTWTNPVDELVDFREIGFVVPEQPDSFFGLGLEDTSFPAQPTPLGQQARVLISSFAEWDLSDAEPGDVFQVTPLDGAPDLLFDIKFFETGSSSAADYTPVAITVDNEHVEGNEGSEVANAGQYFAPDGVDVAVKVFGPEGDLIGDAVLDGGNWSFETVAPDDTEGEGGSVTVTAAVYHDDVWVGEAPFTVTIHNVAPTVMTPQGDGPLVVNAFDENTFDLGTFFDPALLDGDFNADAPFAVEVNWGDGESDFFDIFDVGVIGEEGHPIGELNHTYTRGGEFEVTVTVTDNEGDSGSDSFDVEVTSTSGIGVGAVRLLDGNADVQFGFFVVVNLPADLSEAPVFARGPGDADFVQGHFDPFNGDWNYEIDLPLSAGSFADVYGDGIIDFWVDSNPNGQLDAADALFEIALRPRAEYEAAFPGPFANVTPEDGSSQFLGTDPLRVEWENPAPGDGGPADFREIDIFSGNGEDSVDIAFEELGADDTSFETEIPVAGQPVSIELNALAILQAQLNVEPVGGFTPFDISQSPTAAETVVRSTFTPLALTVDNETVSVDEGRTATNSGDFANPTGAPVTIIASRGAVQQTGGSNGTWSWSLDTTDGPAESGEITISLKEDGAVIDTVTFDLTVRNLRPTATRDATVVTVDEGATATNSGTFVEPVGESVTVSVNIGTVTTGPDGAWNWTFDTTDGVDDSQRVKVVFTDKDGGVRSAPFDLIVNNVAPDVTVDHASVTKAEGKTAVNSGTFDDPGDDDVTITASVGTITQDAGNSGNWSWTFDTTDGPDESQTVSITATDSDGASSSVTFDLTVNNRTPEYTAAADQAADANIEADFNLGSFTDPGADSPWKVTVDWGDGDSEMFTTSAAGSLGTRSHTYATTGDFTVTVTVAEENGGGASDSGTFDVSVVVGFEALRIDLGTGTAGTLAEGFVELGKQNRYDATRGYGWESNSNTFRRNSIDDALLRDGHLGRRNTFMVDVPNGRYKVTITMGDQSSKRGPTNVSAEGDLMLEAISTAKGEFTVETFFVDVTDGRLDLFFEKDSGRSAWAVNAIEIELDAT